jgi:hypothetical protein
MLKAEEVKDLRKFPLDKLAFMVLCYITMLIISLLKGSEKMGSIIGVEVYI